MRKEVIMTVQFCRSAAAAADGEQDEEEEESSLGKLRMLSERERETEKLVVATSPTSRYYLCLCNFCNLMR